LHSPEAAGRVFYPRTATVRRPCLNAGIVFPHARSPRTSSVTKQTAFTIPSLMLPPLAGEAGTSVTQVTDRVWRASLLLYPGSNKAKTSPVETLTGAALSSFFTEGGNGFLKTSSAENFSSPVSF